MGYEEMPCTRRCHGAQGDAVGHEEMPWGTRRCYGARGDAVGYKEMLWGTRRCRGVQGDAVGHEEMPCIRRCHGA